MSPTFPRWLRRIVQALVILALTAGLTELAFRLLHHLHPIFVFPQASYDRFRARPGVDVYGTPINSQGFKDVEHPLAKPAGVYRILAVGDSFVYGIVPYEDLFLTLLEKALGQGRRTPIEIVKMGIPRTGVADYFALLAREGLRYQPDLVLVCVFVGNDFDLENDEPPPRSYLWAFLRFVFGVLPEVEGQVYKDDHYDETLPTFGAEGYVRIQSAKLEAFRRDGTWLEPRLESVLEDLDRIAKLCRYEGTELLVVLMPDELQVDPAARRMVLTGLAEDPASFDFERPNRLLADALTERGIASRDLLPALVAAAREEPVYKPRDTHWNRRGNRVAAQTLSKALEQETKLPP